MKTPQVIYIGEHALWSEEKIPNNPVYFSEQAVRNALVKAYTNSFLLVGDSTLMAEKHAKIRVENVINKMKGDNE